MNQKHQNGNVVAGIVVKVAFSQAFISLTREDGGKPGEFVVIRPEFHRTPVIDGRQKHGLWFGGLSWAKTVAVCDRVLLLRHEKYPKVAEAWCYDTDRLAIRGVASPTLSTKGEAKSQKPKKLSYGERRRLRRAEEFQLQQSMERELGSVADAAQGQDESKILVTAS